MPDDLLIKTAGLAIFLAIVGGGTYAAYDTIYPEGLSLGGISVASAAEAPSATYGRAFDVPFTVSNALSTAQTVRVDVQAASGFSASPVEVQVPAGGVAAGTLRVSAPATGAGEPATLTLVASPLESPERVSRTPVTVLLSPPGLTLEFPISHFNATPGHRLNVPVVVNATDGRAHEASLRFAQTGGLAPAGDPPKARVSATRGAGVFLPLDVPAGTQPGERTLVVEAASGALSVRGSLTVTVLEAGEGVGEGGEATVLYVGRFDDGSLFNTNVPEIDGAGEFPREDMYRLSPGTLPVTTGARANVVPGFARGVVGMQVGETRGLVLAPEEAYGNATLFEEQERREDLEREVSLPRQNDSIPRESFDQFIDSTDQGPAEGFDAGDTFRFQSGPNEWPFRIVEINEEEVRYVLDPELDRGFTLFPFWANASVVVAKNDTHVTFRTTPTTAVEEPFTYNEHWENASTVESVNETTIVVVHSPREGSTYEIQQGPFAPAQMYTVEEVLPDKIVVSHPNPSPLGGRTLVFDVTRVS